MHTACTSGAIWCAPICRKSYELLVLRLRSEQRRVSVSLSRRTDQWIGNDSSTMTIARKAEIAGRVLAQESKVGRMRAIRHCERAAEMVFIFLKGHLRLFAEGYVSQIDLLDDGMPTFSATGVADRIRLAISKRIFVRSEPPSLVRLNGAQSVTISVAQGQSRLSLAGPMQRSWPTPWVIRSMHPISCSQLMCP